MQKFCGIYCIENIVDNKKYIGKSVNISSRWKSHLSALKNKAYNNNYLQNSYNKHGESCFYFSILEICSNDYLNDREKYYIQLYKTKVSNGYNFDDGGSEKLNLSQETKIKLSLSKMGKRNPNFGKKDSEETRQRKIASNSGKNKGLIRSEEFKKRLSIIAKQNYKPHYHSEDFKRKLSEERMGDGNPLFATKRKDATSQYYGVCFDKSKSKWKTSINYMGKQMHIGSSDNEIDAAKIYDNYIKNKGINYPLNFPKDNL
jgi:group I intron endonuclease